jgi:hypothetical protein
LFNGGVWGLFGVSASIAGHARAPIGLALGPELSFAYQPEMGGFWVGGYVDAKYDFGSQEGRISAGPELGVAFFGVDGGLYRRVGSGPDQFGLQVRALLTMGVFALYGGYGATLAGAGAQSSNFFEVGLMAKYPKLVVEHEDETEECRAQSKEYERQCDLQKREERPQRTPR